METKNKLWVYGCSYSQRFNPEMVDISWPEIVSDKLNLELNNRAEAGWGWNFIKDRIDEDFIQWSKNDLIIISPSLFSRISVVEMKDPFASPIDCPWITELKNFNELHEISENRWKNTILNLLHCGYNVWTWPWNKTKYLGIIPQLIPNPQTSQIEDSWDDWNQNTKQYWCKTYPHLINGVWIKHDTHFNNDGHKFIAEYMLKFIK